MHHRASETHWNCLKASSHWKVCFCNEKFVLQTKSTGLACFYEVINLGGLRKVNFKWNVNFNWSRNCSCEKKVKSKFLSLYLESFQTFEDLCFFECLMSVLSVSKPELSFTKRCYILWIENRLQVLIEIRLHVNDAWKSPASFEH